MKVFIEHDLPCFELKKLKNGVYIKCRWFLMGNLHYELSNVEVSEGDVYFELRDEQGLIGKYLVLIDNWKRLVTIKNKVKKKKVIDIVDNSLTS